MLVMLLVVWVLVVVVVMLLLLVHVGRVLLHGGLVNLEHWVQVCQRVHGKVHMAHWGNGRQGRQGRHGSTLVGWRMNWRHVLVMRDLDMEGVTHIAVHQ
jgi:hypothetical protein